MRQVLQKEVWVLRWDDRVNLRKRHRDRRHSRTLDIDKLAPFVHFDMALPGRLCRAS